jgi:DNA-binding NtrC family response regulator
MAENAAQALEVLSTTRVEVVLLDADAAAVDAYAVCEQIQSKYSTRDMAVVFLGHSTDGSRKIRALQAGAADYLSKPVSAEELLLRLHRHLALVRGRRALEEQNARLRMELKTFHHRAGMLLEQNACDLDFTDTIEAAAPAPAPTRPEHQSLMDIERNHIVRILEQTGWRIEGTRGAAHALGLHPSTLRGRLRKLGVRRAA